MKGDQGVVGLDRDFKEWCPHEVVRNLPIKKNLPVPGSGGTSGEPERMLGHLEAERMSIRDTGKGGRRRAEAKAKGQKEGGQDKGR